MMAISFKDISNRKLLIGLGLPPENGEKCPFQQSVSEGTAHS